MPKKPKTNQKQITDNFQTRDLFQTPNYATDLLIPFMRMNRFVNVWECSAGEMKIVDRLSRAGFFVSYTDIRLNAKINQEFNFLLDSNPSFFFDCIVTNPPFSLKYKFIDRALEYDVPFAFLIPFDMCTKMTELFKLGCEGLVPTRRVDYITPTGLSGATGHTSYYHSFWLTYRFNLPNQLTFVELSLRDKKENI